MTRSPAPPNATGNPGEAPPFSFPVSRCGPAVKALEKGRVQPMYAKARTWGTRPGGKGLVGSRKSRGRNDANTPNRAEVAHCSRFVWLHG
jgi:hypothetical protein